MNQIKSKKPRKKSVQLMSIKKIKINQKIKSINKKIKKL